MRRLHRKLFFVGPLLGCSCYGGHNDALFAGIEPGSFFAIQDDTKTTLTLWRDQTFVALETDRSERGFTALSEKAITESTLTLSGQSTENQTLDIEALTALTRWSFERFALSLGSPSRATGPIPTTDEIENGAEGAFVDRCVLDPTVIDSVAADIVDRAQLLRTVCAQLWSRRDGKLTSYSPAGTSRSSIRLFPDPNLVCVAGSPSCFETRSAANCRCLLPPAGIDQVVLNRGAVCEIPPAAGNRCAWQNDAWVCSEDSSDGPLALAYDPQYSGECEHAAFLEEDSLLRLESSLSPLGQSDEAALAPAGNSFIVAPFYAAGETFAVIGEAGLVSIPADELVPTASTSAAFGHSLAVTAETQRTAEQELGIVSIAARNGVELRFVRANGARLSVSVPRTLQVDAAEFVGFEAVAEERYLLVTRDSLSFVDAQAEPVATSFVGSELAGQTWVATHSFTDRSSAFRHSDVTWALSSELRFARVAHTTIFDEGIDAPHPGVGTVAGFDTESLLVGDGPNSASTPRAIHAVAPDRVIVALQSDAGRAELWELVQDPTDSSCQQAGPYCFRRVPGVDVIDCGEDGGNVLHVLGELDVLTVIFDSGYVWSLGGTCARVEGTQAGLRSAAYRRTGNSAVLALLTTDRNLIFERINSSSL